ncbi:MAG: DUF3299 domain-containing protein [Henriciella sp.]|nr:DUF3299 domain-containing protein [Henriciella sp.]
MNRLVICGLALALSACGAAETSTSESSRAIAPPPIPEGVETVEFQAATMSQAEAAAAAIVIDEPAQREPVYWGVKEGEALTIMWEDLMPEGSEEALAAEYEQFYATLEKRYAANTTTLANAGDPYAAIAEGSELDFMPQLGGFETVDDLDGVLVRIPGYVVPFDFSSDARLPEFLFVPYMGACIHTPPPAPNQIVFIRTEEAVRVKDIWAPYWIEGTLRTERTDNELGNTAYALEMNALDPYPMR